MFLDFEKIDVKTLQAIYANDTYFSSVLSFVEQYISQPSFTSFTSGSTGVPKEIVVEKHRAEESARLSNHFFGVTNTTQFLLCLDIQFIGSKMLLIRAIIARAKVLVTHPSLNFYQEIDTTLDIDFISLTPLHIYHIIKYQPSFFDKVSICLIGASMVTPYLAKKINGLCTHTVFYESFAMTETISHFALRNISQNQVYFKILEGFEISQDETNCLAVYHSIVLPQWIKTNDVVEIIDKDKFIFCGRIDNVINSGGIKIHPEILEKEWSEFLPFQFVLVGEDDEILGQKVVMILVDNAIATTADIYDLLSAHNIAKRLFPKVIYRSSEPNFSNISKLKRKEILKSKIELLPS